MSLPRCDLRFSDLSTGVHSDPLESSEFLEAFWRRRETLDAVPAALFAKQVPAASIAICLEDAWRPKDPFPAASNGGAA